jgi:predicted DsbA family dithiol-disulfide isomerase
VSADRIELRVTVFSDYICPFCYVGNVRLDRLREHFDLKVNWCFLEIHPETPAAGRPVSELGYEPDHWLQMMAVLEKMIKEEDLPFAGHVFTANSHLALLLAESLKAEGAETFYSFHRQLFKSYFADAENIGDKAVLARVARDAGVSRQALERAWTDERYEICLQQYCAAAHELGVTATPTYFVGHERLNGAVSAAALLAAANRAQASGAGTDVGG